MERSVDYVVKSIFLIPVFLIVYAITDNIIFFFIVAGIFLFYILHFMYCAAYAITKRHVTAIPLFAVFVAAMLFLTFPGLLFQERTRHKDEYVASASSEIYHIPGCRYADKISDKNIVYYKTEADAQKDGKTPCSVCDP
ncbi:MAG: Ada metal-binding domain-containing protein [Oscillospiraceae bacterium]